MKILEIRSLAIPDVKVVRYARFGDERGYFTETYRKSDFFGHADAGCFAGIEFKQCNESRSRAGVVRGLHFQWNPCQGKLVRTIAGHMIDSSANNRQRFVRASAEGEHTGPQYGQDAWVAAHGYASQSWETLLGWWNTEHAILAAVVDHISEDRLEASYAVGSDAPVTLRFLIEDYIAHQKWHLKQASTGVTR